MTYQILSAAYPSLATTLGNHLWQSTLFAAVAGLCTLFLRKNQAQARYWIWMAASLKFLVPFSWLVAVGSRLAWLRSSAETQPAFYMTVEEMAQPFSAPARADVPLVAASLTSPLIHSLPEILAGLWLLGFLFVLCLWCVRWRRISIAIHNSVPVRDGREFDALRRLENITGLRQRTQLLLSSTMLEPGIFGIFRPVLIWPEGISENLDTSHLDAILAHELWHVRRRDNLFAAVHMLVEAVFWFHPLVWWLGSRLIEERERACDEQVVESGSERRVYAESILKVCEFCVGSPLPCVSGVTGSDLKKRMVHIMSMHVGRKLDFTRKILLTVVAVAALATPVIFGLVNATPSRAQSTDDSAGSSTLASGSIRPSQPSTPSVAGGDSHLSRMMFSPDGFTAVNVTLRSLIQEAYGVQANQISGPADMLDKGAYDVDGKTAKSAPGKLDPEHGRMERQVMLQSLLAERAKLVLHRENRAILSYALGVADSGSKLQAVQGGEGQKVNFSVSDAQVIGTRRMLVQGGGNDMGVAAQGASVSEIARLLSMQLAAPVVDKTGLTGNYDFNLHWTPAGQDKGGDAADHTSLFTAVQEQLGLTLVPQNKPMQVLVIDHIEQPDAN